MAPRSWRQFALIDTTPLARVTGYRWLFAGMLFDDLGRQMVIVAVPVQVYQLTESSLAVGFLGLAQFVPLLFVSVVGGALADAVERRRILVVSQFLQGVTAVGLLWNALVPEPQVWPLYALVAINAGVSAIHSPAHNAVTPGLVGRSLLPSALALNQLLSSITQAVVPAIAGLLIASVGLHWSYGIQATSFILGALSMRRIPEIDIEGGGRKFGISSVLEGFAFLRSRRLIQASFLIDLNAMVLGMPTALFPAFGTEVLGGDAFTVGLLYAAPGIGALLGALTSGWVATIRYQGRAVIGAVICWGLAITAFGLSRSPTFSMAMLAVAGAADVISAIFRNSIVQLIVPDGLRGRLSSMHLAVTAGGPHLGDLESGVVAALTTVRFSIVAGGLGCIVGALSLARWAPSLVAYRYESTGGDDPAAV